MLSMNTTDFILRLLVVILIGLAIGLERQLTGHNVSFKTTILIAIGSFAFIATEVFIGSPDTRMAANVITGIGFLCSGVIFKNGLSVNGLTTAAALWSTAAFAVLVGYGYIKEGLIGTAFVLVANVITALTTKHVHPIHAFVSTTETIYYLRIECLQNNLKKVKKIVLAELPKSINIAHFEIETLTGTKRRIVYQLTSSEEMIKAISDLSDKILEKDVISVSFERSEE